MRRPTRGDRLIDKARELCALIVSACQAPGCGSERQRCSCTAHERGRSCMFPPRQLVCAHLSSHPLLSTLHTEKAECSPCLDVCSLYKSESKPTKQRTPGEQQNVLCKKQYFQLSLYQSHKLYVQGSAADSDCCPSIKMINADADGVS